MSQRSNEAYGQHGVTWVDRFGVWLSGRAIKRALPTGSSLRVLDVGCGYNATLLMALGSRMTDGWGLDFQVNPGLREKQGFTFVEGAIDGTLPTVPRGHFDGVMIISVLEHLSDPLMALKIAQDALRPGGVMLVNVPTWRGKCFLEFSAFRLGLSPKTEMDDHKMYYDKHDLWPLLVRAGFKPSQIRLKYHKFGLNLFAIASKAVAAGH